MGRRYSLLEIYLFVTMLLSSFVMIEPSLYDLSMALFLFLLLLSAQIALNKTILIPILICLTFLLTNLVSMFFVQNYISSIAYFSITTYLVGTFILLIGFSQKTEGQYFYLILRGYYWAAIISSFIGLLAYFNLFSASEQFLLFGRVKSTFKDPNVFGPFLVLPALFAINMMELTKTSFWKKNLYFFSFLILLGGILLSFSRAAWGNFIISFVIYFALVKNEMVLSRFKMILLLVIIGTPIFIYFIQIPAVEELLASRASYQSYDDNRFETQKDVYLTGFSNPLGLGGGQSDIVFQRSPHSLFARVLMENGILGLFSIILLITVSLVESFRRYRLSGSQSGNFHLIIFASIIGLVFNSFFVDSLHWRHLWIILALAWGLNMNEEKSN